MTRNIASKKTLLSLMLVCAFSSPHPLQAGRVRDREMKQEDRLQDGVATGQLNAAEARRLESAERKLKKKVARDKADGNFSEKEKEHINRRQNNLSNRIWRQKHDAQTAGAKTRMMNDQRRKLIGSSKGGLSKAPSAKIKKP